MREVVSFLKYSKDEKKLEKLLQENDRFQNLDWKAANTIKECAGIEMEIEEEEGSVNMCKAIEDMQKRKYEEGVKDGESQGISQGILVTLYGLVKDGILKTEEAAARAEMSVAEFHKRCDELLLS